MMSKYWYIGRSTWRSHFSTEKPNDNSKSTGQVDGNCILSQMPTRQDDDDNLFHILNTYNNFFFLSLHSFDSIKLLSSAFHSEMLCVCVCVFATFIVCWKARLITFSFQSHFLVVEVFNAIVICRFQWCAALKKASERERKRMKERESERENYFWKKKRIRGRGRERERARNWCILFYHFGCHYSDFFRIVRVEYAFFRIVCVCVRHPFYLFFSLIFSLSFTWTVSLFIRCHCSSSGFIFPSKRCVIYMNGLHFIFLFSKSELTNGATIMMPKNQESEQVLGFFEVIMTREWMNIICKRKKKVEKRKLIQPERTLPSITMVAVVTNP